MVGPKCFLPGPTKMLSLQNEEKTEWELIFSWLTKMLMCTCLYLFIYFLLSWQLAVMLPFFFFFFRPTLPLLFFIFLFSRLGSGRSFFFFFLFFWFSRAGSWFFFFFFFKDLIFIFLVNLGDCSFFFVVICHFFVLIGHHSLTMVY